LNHFTVVSICGGKVSNGSLLKEFFGACKERGRERVRVRCHGGAVDAEIVRAVYDSEEQFGVMGVRSFKLMHVM
jgi:hypothetical protein